MKYRVEISSLAEAEADRAFLSLLQLMSPDRASQWQSGLIEAIESWSIMPSRCPLARENEYFSQEIRQPLQGFIQITPISKNNVCYCSTF